MVVPRRAVRWRGDLLPIPTFVGQIYLLDNPLLREPLRARARQAAAARPLGTTPGRTSSTRTSTARSAQRDLDAIYVSGPGHGGPALVANA